ncbi:MAG: asparaginase [Clostridia bacterium]|nr:asparaginase [Clostridia bacterium]MBQ8850785.1 asparaginase [Clostridia bacterium]
MTKKILVVATGGTIGSSFIDGERRLNADVAKSILLDNFAESSSPYASLGKALFADSELKLKTLSENITLGKLFSIAEHIRKREREELAGIIVLHGTDTLAFSAAMLSLLFCDIDKPMILVSGNCPPDYAESNANANFRAAVELICGGLAPNVYAAYRNSDGRMYLHLGSTLLQCADRSEDFLNASREKVFLLDRNNELLPDGKEKCRELSNKRRTDMGGLMRKVRSLERCVMLIRPYVGLDYSMISLQGVCGVVHGVYHSGTVCVDGSDGRSSVIRFGKRCDGLGIPMFIAPCKLDESQYESAYEAERQGLVPLNITTELAYCKLLVGVSAGLSKPALREFMETEINGEYLDQTE